MSNDPVSVAKRIHNEFGICKPEQIAPLLTVISIAEYYDLHVLPEIMDNCFARLTISPSGAGLIRYNTKINYEPTIKYSIAHELGHYFLHKDTMLKFRDYEYTITKPFNNSGMERQADEFAAELLIPNSMLIAEINSCNHRNPDFNLVKSIASKFNVSITATAMKIVKSGIFILALIAAENNRIKWFNKDPRFRLRLKSVGTELDSESCAGQYFTNNEIEAEPQEMLSEIWVTNASKNEIIIEHNFVSQNNCFTLSLIWVKDDIL